MDIIRSNRMFRLRIHWEIKLSYQSSATGKPVFFWYNLSTKRASSACLFFFSTATGERTMPPRNSCLCPTRDEHDCARMRECNKAIFSW